MEIIKMPITSQAGAYLHVDEVIEVAKLLGLNSLDEISVVEEAADGALMLELEWKSTLTHVVEAVRRLDEVVGEVSNSTFSNDNNDMLDTNGHVVTPVTSAINRIQDLQGKLEATYAGHDALSSAYKEVNEQYNDLLRKKELMIEILYELYNDLKKLVIGSCVPMGAPRINSNQT
ncbi:hypothetical protein COLO4_19568 [Corchorus olitorius]|uniref:Uncharacterized protein n=1 Tax=Corchorus olitorius TaxID=93759 RepID=A0A1R3J4S7_9ROSI|nr:hypothetical protein COLO4_19568 [Corchorus olitorius]